MKWSYLKENIICGPENHALGINQACLNITNQLDVPFKFYTRANECFECDYLAQKYLVSSKSTTSFVIDTNYGIDSYIMDDKNIYCKMTSHFEDFGVYSFNITKNHSCSEINTLIDPEKFWLNMTLLFCIYLSLALLCKLSMVIYRKSILYYSSSGIPLRELETDLGRLTCKSETSRNNRNSRVASIDAFRGLAIFIMIFVNYNGGNYSVFKHSPWNGLTIADLVFPWFVWIMGASIGLSIKSNLRHSRSKKSIFFHVLRRSIFLVFLGLMLNSGQHKNSSLRICGVLQRLGVTYFVVASVEILTIKSETNELLSGNEPVPFNWHYCHGFIGSVTLWLLEIACIATHLMVTFLLKVPGCPTGYLGPGGLSNHSVYRNCTGGAAGYIDRIVITDKHMYQRGTFANIFKTTVPYDPEGLLGTLMSFLCAFFGVHAGRIILRFGNPSSRIKNWLTLALFTGLISGFLCSWSQNDGIIPINKNLWSLSYVLVSSSMAFTILAAFYFLIDSTQIWSGFPFTHSGMNAITLYLGHSLLKNQLPWKWVPFSNTHFELLLMDSSAATIWLFIAYLMHKYNIFITL